MSFSEIKSILSQRWSQGGAEALWVTIGQTLTFAGAVLAVKILTTLLSPSEYGALALGLSLAGAMNMFVYGPLGQVVLRFYSICQEERSLDSFFASLRRVHAQLSGILLVCGVLIDVLVWWMWGAQWGVLVMITILFGVVSGLQGALLSLANAMRQRSLAAVSQFADVWVRLILSLTLVAVIGATGLCAMIGYLIGSALVFGWQVYQLPAEVWRAAGTDFLGAEASDRLQGRFWEYGVPFVSFAGVAVVSQYADRWLLQAFWGQHEVGIYAALYQVASAPVAFVMSIVNQIIIPLVFQRVGSRSSIEGIGRGRALLTMTERFLVATFFCMTVGVFLWGEPLVRFLTSAEYASQSHICWIIMLGLSVFNLGQLSSILGYSLNRTDVYIWPKVFQGVTVLILGGLLARHQGVVGMAMALLGASSLYLISIKFIHMRCFNQKARLA